jgi:hypothetical protein
MGHTGRWRPAIGVTNRYELSLIQISVIHKIWTGRMVARGEAPQAQGQAMVRYRAISRSKRLVR